MLAEGLPPRDRGRGALKQSVTNQSIAGEDQPLNQITTKSIWTAHATQNKNKEVYRAGKARPGHLPT